MPTLSRQFEAALRIIEALRADGHQAYLVGGCVRDLLLGRNPADYDVATSATPDLVLDMFPRTFAVGAHFGVVLVADEALDEIPPLEDAGDAGPRYSTTEVATFRSDGAYSDGRRPDTVRYTQNPEEDAQRRDFTINGLLLDPTLLVRAQPEQQASAVRAGLLDYVGGLADLDAEIVRAIGEPRRRFEEDQLRLLRAVRFAARFGYTLHPPTHDAIRALAPRIHSVSRERVRDELTKMLTEGRARQAFELLDETGLLAQVLPEITRMHGVQQPPQFHPEGDVFIHTLMLLDQLRPGAPCTLAWGALLHDVGKPPTFRAAPDRIRFDGHVEVGVAMGAEICRRFRFSNEDTLQILALIEHHMRFADAPRMKASTLKRFFRLPCFEDHLALHKMDCLAAHANLDIFHYVEEQYHSMPQETVRPHPLVTGRELIAAGYPPGPRFKEMLQAAEDAQLEGSVTTTGQAMALVRNRFGAPEPASKTLSS
ncbi:MAG TPA: CCA tRNA nucleotidyltransferase [Terracidiphilus sp.]